MLVEFVVIKLVCNICTICSRSAVVGKRLEPRPGAARGIASLTLRLFTEKIYVQVDHSIGQADIQQ